MVLELLTERNWWVGVIGSGKANLEIPQKHPKVLNLVGELPLSKTMALIERADGVLTTDSGPLHTLVPWGGRRGGFFGLFVPSM